MRSWSTAPSISAKFHADGAVILRRQRCTTVSYGLPQVIPVQRRRMIQVRLQMSTPAVIPVDSTRVEHVSTSDGSCHGILALWHHDQVDVVGTSGTTPKRPASRSERVLEATPSIPVCRRRKKTPQPDGFPGHAIRKSGPDNPRNSRHATDTTRSITR